MSVSFIVLTTSALMTLPRGLYVTLGKWGYYFRTCLLLLMTPVVCVILLNVVTEAGPSSPEGPVLFLNFTWSSFVISPGDIFWDMY